MFAHAYRLLLNDKIDEASASLEKLFLKGNRVYTRSVLSKGYLSGNKVALFKFLFR
jgi:hypothetical protein